MVRRLSSLLALLPALACSAGAGSGTDQSDSTVAETDESVLMLVGTNDMHGSFDNLARFAGYVSAAKAHLAHTYGAERSSLVLLDAGDATQGTLLSNFSEGTVAIDAMNAVGYTAAVAGNHGFDFGPIDWTRDHCASSVGADAAVADCDPLAALHRSVAAAKFPFLGANVTTRADGKNLDFLPPFTIVPFQGRGVAILGLENHFTASTTEPANVAALAFGEGSAELQREVESLYGSGRADVFVLVMHEGDGDTASMGQFLSHLPRRSDGAPLVDAAIAGHSHRINDAVSGDVPYIQSGANGTLFGTIDLVTKKDASGRLVVQRERTVRHAAIPIDEASTTFLSEPIVPSDEVARIVAAAHAAVAPIAGEILTQAPAPVTRADGRIEDSEVGNLLTDAMRSASGATVALVNGGDVRSDLPAGPISFQDLFAVLPKNLDLVRIRTMPTHALVENVTLSVKSCGRRGALQISGVTIVFTRSCTAAVQGEDRAATLLALVGPDGKALYDRGVEKVPTVDVVTTDFVLSGGAGYDAFAGLVPTDPVTPLRAAVATELHDVPLLSAPTYAHGRYVNCVDTPTHPLCAR